MTLLHKYEHFGDLPDGRVNRLKIPGGWLYILFFKDSLTATFVPDTDADKVRFGNTREMTPPAGSPEGH